ncbi:transporter [Pedobacter sp. ASV28]|uniref:transporter n=1 Tax=Pedobacter sp. ASV28 TaxID=2795123 RepID=UPI0018ED8C83|nr:transporter [Pedobacter sp. ASV28]
MMRFMISLFLFSLIFKTDLYAQNENFASDRPGLSDAPDLIDKKTWQIASGFDISKYNHYGVYQLSQNTLKYGISKRFEARLDFGLQYDPEKKIYGSSGPSLGLKTLLTPQHQFIPKTAFIIEYYPPPFSAAQQSSGLGTEFCFSHNFKNGNSLYYNIGANWLDIESKPTLNTLMGFSYQVNEVLHIFAEFYLYKVPEIRLNYVSDIGMTYQFNKKLQFDFATGLDIIKPNGNSYFNCGISYNF